VRLNHHDCMHGSSEHDDWIYAGDLTAQLGLHGAIQVLRRLEQVISTGDLQEARRWAGIARKVEHLIWVEAEGVTH
jgi:hypothetical protein